MPPSEARAAAAGHREAHGRRLPPHRHGSLRAARRRSGAGAGGRHPAPQLHGLHHACRLRSDRARRERHQPHRRFSFSQNPRDLPAWEIAVDQGQLPVWRGLDAGSDDRVRARRDPAAHVPRPPSTSRPSNAATTSISGIISPTRSQRLEPLVDDGLVEFDAQRIAATSRGRLLLRIIAMCFDHYLRHLRTDGAPRYSRASSERSASRARLPCSRDDRSPSPDRRRRR